MSFLFFSTHAGRSLLGGLAEGQLAVILPLLPQSGPEGSRFGWGAGIGGGAGVAKAARGAGRFLMPVNLRRPSGDTGIVFRKTQSLSEPNHCSSLNCSM